MIELTRYRPRDSTEVRYEDALTPGQCARLARVIAGVSPVEGFLPYWLSRMMSVVAQRLDDDHLRDLADQYLRTRGAQPASIPAQRLLLEAFAAATAERAR